MEDRIEEIKPCICCHNACFNMSHYKGIANGQSIYDASHIARCALNPPVMQSKKYKIEPAKVKKNIAIIGGGIGGIEAAIVCAKRGHTVTLYEKTNELGGVFIAAAAPSYKEKDKMLIDWYKREITRYPSITIKLNTLIENIDTLEADEVIVATGSRAKRIPVPRADKAIQAVDFLLGNKPVGNKVVIIGGGLTGCEIAYELYLQGKTPVIVEAQHDLIVSKAICLANTSYLRDFFNANNVEVHLESSVKEILDDKVVIGKKDGSTIEVSADSVIMSVGYNPNPLTKKQKHVHIIGDAAGVGNLRTVIWGAWDVCMKL